MKTPPVISTYIPPHPFWKFFGWITTIALTAVATYYLEKFQHGQISVSLPTFSPVTVVTNGAVEQMYSGHQTIFVLTGVERTPDGKASPLNYHMFTNSAGRFVLAQ